MHSPFSEVVEEFPTEGLFLTLDLRRQMAEEGEEMGVDGGGAPASPVTQDGPELRKDRLPHVHMLPTILRKYKILEPQNSQCPCVLHHNSLTPDLVELPIHLYVCAKVSEAANPWSHHFAFIHVSRGQGKFNIFDENSLWRKARVQCITPVRPVSCKSEVHP